MKPVPYVGTMDTIAFRRARAPDLPAIIALLADDELGRAREDVSLPTVPAYETAFAAIDADPNQLLAVVCEGERVIGTLQITFIPGPVWGAVWLLIGIGTLVALRKWIV